MKSLKVIYKDDTKRASKIPDSFSSLYEMIPGLFPSENLTRYTLKYKDSDDDFVSIASEQDFKLMLESCDGAIKIYVSPQELEKSFVSLNESVQISEKVAKDLEIAPKPEESSPPVEQTKENKEINKSDASRQELYEQLENLREQKEETWNKIREVRSKIVEIKNAQHDEPHAKGDVKQQRRQERIELNKLNDELVKVKEALGGKMYALKEKLRGKPKEPKEPSAEEIDFDALNKERVDEIVKEVLIDLLPVISRKVLHRIKKEFQPNKKSLVATYLEEETKHANKSSKWKEIEQEINVPVLGEMKKDSQVAPSENRFNMSYDQPIIIPKEILPGTDQKIWVTIEIKNTGVVRWPKGAKLYHVRGLDSSDKLYVPELYPADHQKITLMFENPKIEGHHESVWKLGYETTAGVIEYIGKEVVVKIKVQEPKAKKGKGKAAEVAPPVPAKPEVSDKALQEALKLQEAFPSLTLDQLIKVIKENPNASMEEHVNSLLQLTQ